MKLYRISFISLDDNIQYYYYNSKLRFYTEDGIKFWMPELQRESYPNRTIKAETFDFGEKTIQSVKDEFPDIEIVESPLKSHPAPIQLTVPLNKAPKKKQKISAKKKTVRAINKIAGAVTEVPTGAFLSEIKVPPIA